MERGGRSALDDLDARIDKLREEEEREREAKREVRVPARLTLHGGVD